MSLETIFTKGQLLLSSLAALVVKAETSEVVEVEQTHGRVGVILPNDRKFEDLTDALAKREQFLYELEEKRGSGPRQITDIVVAQTLDGFCAMVNRHKGWTTKIDAEFDGVGGPRLVGKIDYHGASDGVGGPLPRWNKHRIEYGFPFTRQFEAWKAAGKYVEKREFLDWAETTYIDIADPTDSREVGPLTKYYFDKVMASKKGWTEADRKAATMSAVFGNAAELLEGARNMAAASQESLEEKIDENGNVAVTYKKSDALINAVARRYFLVDLKVFQGDTATRCIPARLDTHVENGRLSLRIVLLGLEDLIEAAFDEARKTVHETTNIEPMRVKA